MITIEEFQNIIEGMLSVRVIARVRIRNAA